MNPEELKEKESILAPLSTAIEKAVASMDKETAQCRIEHIALAAYEMGKIARGK